MLYIVSQNGLRIVDFHTASIEPPEYDPKDDGVYIFYVNGVEFARYKEMNIALKAMDNIKKFIHIKDNSYYELPEDAIEK